MSRAGPINQDVVEKLNNIDANLTTITFDLENLRNIRLCPLILTVRFSLVIYKKIMLF